ncbi:4'-phosphopantetheinyl transferase superfamily protein [Hyphomicrobium sp. CS1GBMeth3]|uniref:4'-phosphopantetheinyl transferase family protein n=1 Tax=Hyphomicrobium sp. CS1GBMeth3 TaxID=1892845 RepID=UPI0009300251|nr:4'-phosphopantetheinyl transferase superfamily protein [Hyphomicrobium sp. CS1GBMeth3]
MIASAPTSSSTSLPATIDVWTFALDIPDAAALGVLLSPDEHQRADRLQRAEDATRFRVAHARLREILASYLDVDPGRIVLEPDANGKPFVASPETSLHFNLSHSDDLATVAIWRAEVGIDIERVRVLDGPDLEPMFSRSEQAAFAALSGSERREAFFRCWTRKEALLKAWGRGLDVPLDSFDVPVGAEPDVVAQIAQETPDARAWRLLSFAPAAGYAGTVALAADATGRRAELILKTWPPGG